jgi:hypothetical protein
VREVDVNDTELANGDDDGWLAVVLANRLPVFDKANGKSVRHGVPREPGRPARRAAAAAAAVPTFAFELAQDWSVLAKADFSGGPDVQVMGGKAAPGPARAAGVEPRPGSRAAGQVSASSRTSPRQRRRARRSTVPALMRRPAAARNGRRPRRCRRPRKQNAPRRFDPMRRCSCATR